MELRQLVESAFSQPQKCSGHCDQPARFRFLGSGEPTVACYACPAGYVSKVMIYGHRSPDQALLGFLTKAMGTGATKEDEIRTATRHPWDLGAPGVELKVAYWNQNYRSSKSSDPTRQAIFLCSNCGSAYLKPLSAPGTRCAICGP